MGLCHLVGVCGEVSGAKCRVRLDEGLLHGIEQRGHVWGHLTVTAVTAVTAIAVEGWDLRSGMERYPRIGYKVMSSLTEVVARRLRQIEDGLMAYRAYALMGVGGAHG